MFLDIKGPLPVDPTVGRYHLACFGNKGHYCRETGVCIHVETWAGMVSPVAQGAGAVPSRLETRRGKWQGFHGGCEGRIMTRLAARLRRRLTELGLTLPETVRVERTYAGRHQRAQGAWSWQLMAKDGYSTMPSVGSQYTATECAKQSG